METEILRIEQDTQGRYFIADHNDEKLRVIAELLLDKQGRAAAKSLLQNSQASHVRGSRFYLFFIDSVTIGIKFYKPDEPLDEEDNPLIIDINTGILRDLIDRVEDLFIQQPPEIILERRRDSDMVTLTYRPF